MVDFIIALVLLIIVGAAIAYIVKAKKSGTKCIGCPAGGNCTHKHSGASGSCSCSSGANTTARECSGGNTTACECSGESTCGCHADTK